MLNIVRVWKDVEYREGLSVDELVGIPENPAGVIELNDTELGSVVGGSKGSWAIVCIIVENAVDDVVILGGLGILDTDPDISSNERDSVQHALELWQQDPMLTHEQIDGIAKFAEALQECLPPDQWEGLMHSVNTLQEKGSLTDEHLASLTEFVKEMSGE